MANTESAENYLETILILSKQLPVVRGVDIATELGLSPPGWRVWGFPVRLLQRTPVGWNT